MAIKFLSNESIDGTLEVGTLTLGGSAIVAAVGMTLQVDTGNVNAITIDNVGSTTFSGYTYFPNYLFHTGDTNTRIQFTTGTVTLRGDTGITLDGNTTVDGGIRVNGPASYNTIKSANDYTLGFNDSSNVNQWWIKAYTNGNFALHENGIGDQFTIAAGGNVGIKTTSPSSKLQVGDRLDAETITIGGFYAAGGGSLKFISGYASVPSYTWTTGEILATDDGSFNGRLEFKTGDNTRQGPTIKMVIKASGNVGIGTTTPNYQLDIENSGGAIMRLHAGVNSSASLRLKNDAQDWDVNTQTNDTFAIYNQTAATQPFSILPNGNVGITSTNPLNKLHVEGNIQIGGWTTAGSRYVGTARIDNGRFGNGAAGMEVESVTESGQGNYDQKVHLISHRYNGGTSRVLTASWTTGNNRVGIGDTTPSYTLDAAGTIRATGDIIAYSDARVKDNVKTIDNALEKVTKLRGVSYTRNDIEDKSIKVGVIAQEVLKVLPEVVSQDENDKYSVSYGNITGVLIEAIKELKQEIEELKKQIK